MVVFQAQLNELIELPTDVLEALGTRAKRPKVRVTINGVELRTTVAVYGGKSYVGLRREMREAMRVAEGDTLMVDLVLDDAPREIEVPESLETVFAADAEARARFEALSFTNRKEYVEWLTSARRAETREARLARIAEMLKSGRRTPTG